jgi:hypothetical protein
MVEGALEVAENALHNREMELMMVGHVEAHLLNWIGDVRPVKVMYWRAPARLR